MKRIRQCFTSLKMCCFILRGWRALWVPAWHTSHAGLAVGSGQGAVLTLNPGLTFAEHALSPVSLFKASPYGSMFH